MPQLFGQPTFADGPCIVMLLPRKRIRLAFPFLWCPLQDLLHDFQVVPLGIALRGREVAAFAQLVPGVDEHDPLRRRLLRVLVHPVHGRFQGRGELLGRAVGIVRTGDRSQSARALPRSLVPGNRQRGNVRLGVIPVPRPLMGLDQFGILSGLGLGGVTGDDVVMRRVRETHLRLAVAASSDGHAGQSGLACRRLDLGQALLARIGRVEDDHQRLTVHRDVLRMLEVRQPAFGGLCPFAFALE